MINKLCKIRIEEKYNTKAENIKGAPIKVQIHTKNYYDSCKKILYYRSLHSGSQTYTL